MSPVIKRQGGDYFPRKKVAKHHDKNECQDECQDERKRNRQEKRPLFL